jgi:membrane protein YqaA with SNARE-associated domain
MSEQQDISEVVADPAGVRPPTVPFWLWPGVMVALSLACLGLSIRWPSHSLAFGLLPYTFVGNSLAMIPFDWYIPAFVQRYPAWSAVLVATIGTVIIEFWNMELLARLLSREGTRGFRGHHVTRRLVSWFRKAPWWTLVAAGALPVIPFYPCRFLATLANYPMWKYQTSVIVGRSIRYAWLAGLGLLVAIEPRYYFYLGAAFFAVAGLKYLQVRVREGRASA